MPSRFHSVGIIIIICHCYATYGIDVLTQSQISALVLNFVDQKKKNKKVHFASSRRGWVHASVRLPGVLHTNVGHSKFGYRTLTKFILSDIIVLGHCPVCWW